jgi:hypothetical protein
MKFIFYKQFLPLPIKHKIYKYHRQILTVLLVAMGMLIKLVNKQSMNLSMAAQLTSNRHFNNIVNLLPIPHQILTFEKVILRQSRYEEKLEDILTDFSWIEMIFALTNSLTILTHVCACSKPGLEFPTLYVMNFFMFIELRMRDDCLFC